MNLDELANAINKAEQRIEKGLRKTIEDGIQVGNWLLEAKQQLPHGKFEPWCRERLTVKQRMVRYYMQMAKRPDIAKSKGVKTITDFAKTHQRIQKAVNKDDRNERIRQAVAAQAPLNRGWQVHHTDCRSFDWPQLDGIWTDPPWPKTSKELDLYRWLAEMAQDKLRDGGLLAVQCGQTDFAKVLPLFNRFYYITALAIVYRDSCCKFACFLPSWRPVLLFSKGEAVLSGSVTDTVTVGNRQLTKTHHDWQQPLEPFVKWIPALTKPGDMIADPFTCTGTIALACKMTGRRFVGTEINPDMVAVARKRLAECGGGLDAQAG